MNIIIKDKGTISVELDADAAPITVTNFVKLAKEGFYDGVVNTLSHTRGAISMARSQRFDSASSQFFIVHQDSTSLDGQYACFGYVTEGMDIVDDICENAPSGDNGIVPEESRPVIETVEVVEQDQ